MPLEGVEGCLYVRVSMLYLLVQRAGVYCKLLQCKALSKVCWDCASLNLVGNSVLA